jgi:uncharacterized membrane protein YgcG
VCFNTIDSCRDGTIVSLNYVKDINVSSLNGSVFRVGDRIEIDATVFSSSANVEGVFIVYTNATAADGVNWSVIHSVNFGEANSNYHVKVNYTIPNRVGEHAVRVVDEYNQYKNITCGRHVDADFPAYSDTDDVSFTVLPQPAPQVAFASPTPANGSNLTAISFTVNVTHNETHPDTLVLNFNGTNESYAYSGGYTLINKTNLRRGAYTFYVVVNDTFGNVNQTETRTVTINSPIEITVYTPLAGAIYGTLVTQLNVSVRPAESNKSITWAGYALNTNPNVTLTTKLNISVDATDVDGQMSEQLLSMANLSQSLIPVVPMDILNFSIKLKKVGEPNATIQIRGDASNSPSATVYANVSVSNSSVSSADFGWVNLTLNKSLSVANGTRYWLFLWPNGSTTDYYLWEANNDSAYGNGAMLHNSSRDFLFRIFDLYTYITTFDADDGSNRVTIYANSSDNITIASSAITFIGDSNPPGYVGPTESSDPVEIGNPITISITATDGESGIHTVVFEHNSTNKTMTAVGNNLYNITFTAAILGANSYTIRINDSFGNSDTTPADTFTVVDTRGPGFSSISQTPGTADGLDPGIVVNVTVTVSDYGGLSFAKLQYRNNSESDWRNTTMSNSSSLYFANFTPAVAGNWTYRIWANDSTGNVNTSQNVTLNISYDYGWERFPATFSPLSGIKGTVVTIGNLTINNTGDFLFSFSVSSNRAFVTYNDSITFLLLAGQYKVLQVNATTPLEEAEYSIQLTIDAENSSANPDTAQSNATLASIASGPYLFVEILSYNASLFLNDYTQLIAKITNIGNETAINVTSNWSLPSGWVNLPEDLNKSHGNLSVNQVAYHNITAVVDSSSSTGTQTITLRAWSNFGTNDSESKSVTVSSNSVSEDSSSGSSGGGGSSSSGGGGGSLVLIGKPAYDAHISVPKRVEAFPNQNKTIIINITNSIEGTLLRDVRVSVEGFLSTKMHLNATLIKRLLFNETAPVALSLEIPPYFTYQDIELTLTLIGRGEQLDSIKNSTSSSAGAFNKTAEINIAILEVTKDVAAESISAAEDSFKQMEALGLPVSQLEKALADAKKAFEGGDYLQAREIAEGIRKAKQEAMEAIALLREIGFHIDAAKKSGTDIAEVEALAQLAAELLSKGDFEGALRTVREAAIAEEVARASARANILLRAAGFVREHWALSGMSALLTLGVGFAIRMRMSLKAIGRMLDGLDKEEGAALSLIRKAQEDYFKHKLMSQRIYERTITHYLKDLARIQKEKIVLRGRRVEVLRRKAKVEALEGELDAVKGLMKKLQEDYYTKKVIAKETYQHAMVAYLGFEAELRKSLEVAKKATVRKGKDGAREAPVVLATLEHHDATPQNQEAKKGGKKAEGQESGGKSENISSLSHAVQHIESSEAKEKDHERQVAEVTAKEERALAILAREKVRLANSIAELEAKRIDEKTMQGMIALLHGILKKMPKTEKYEHINALLNTHDYLLRRYGR